MIRLALPALAASLLAGCAETPPPPRPCPDLPVARSETLPDPRPPVSAIRLTMAPGHWDWNGSGYFWESAAWVPAPNAHPLWQAGSWTPNGGACVWNRPHFLP